MVVRTGALHGAGTHGMATVPGEVTGITHTTAGGILRIIMAADIAVVIITATGTGIMQAITEIHTITPHVTTARRGHECTRIPPITARGEEVGTAVLRANWD